MEAKSYWAGRAEGYRETMDTSYHRSRMAMIDALLAGSDLRGQVCDFGCGDGVYGAKVLRAGGTVHGFDIDESMVKAATGQLTQIGGTFRVEHGGVEKLAGLAAAAFDTVLALNVIAYMSEAEAAEFYRQAARILKTGGVLVCTHSNELFDMFTFNKYTVKFFEQNFAVKGVEQLLVHPDKPERRSLSIRENPLSFRYKLKTFGFEEVTQHFAIPHEAPPLLMKDFDPDDLANRVVGSVVDTAEAERWKLNFTCSTFGSRAVRVG